MTAEKRMTLLSIADSFARREVGPGRKQAATGHFLALTRRPKETLMLKKILIVVGVGLLVLGVVIAAQPDTFHVERSVTIEASPSTVFAQVNDFHAWTAWSPWERLDPQMKRTYDGPRAGVGAKYAWAGNREVGEGRMTIERASPGAVVAVKLEFLKPFEATNTATFTFRAEPGGTRTTWAMDGKNNFASKAMHVVMDMDDMIGRDFERGLNSMKAAAEAAARATPVGHATP